MPIDKTLLNCFAAMALMLSTSAVALARGRWQQVENKPNCAVWNPQPVEFETERKWGRILNFDFVRQNSRCAPICVKSNGSPLSPHTQAKLQDNCN